METRNTIQKSLIYDAVQSLHDHPTADEIYSFVCKRYPNISKGTVYRNLNQMADNGDILRVLIPNAPDRYDFNAKEHAHFFCHHCGKVMDFPLSLPSEWKESLSEPLLITGCDVIIHGLCKDCIN